MGFMVMVLICYSKCKKRSSASKDSKAGSTAGTEQWVEGFATSDRLLQFYQENSLLIIPKYERTKFSPTLRAQNAK